MYVGRVEIRTAAQALGLALRFFFFTLFASAARQRYQLAIDR
jgi:hypothetical protein